MNCNEVLELSGPYISGSLDARRASELAGHLKACPACARQIEIDERLRGAVLSEPVDTTSADSRIRQRIRERSRARWMTLAAGVAAVLIIALVINLARFGADTSVGYAAAQDHRREVVDRQRRAWISEASAVGALAEHEGIVISSVQALAPAGYRFEHAKLCRLGSRAFLHLVYSNGAEEFSIFLRKPGPEPARGIPVEIADLGREHVALFQTGRANAIVVTDESHQACQSLARFAAAIL